MIPLLLVVDIEANGKCKPASGSTGYDESIADITSEEFRCSKGCIQAAWPRRGCRCDDEDSSATEESDSIDVLSHLQQQKIYNDNSSFSGKFKSE